MERFYKRSSLANMLKASGLSSSYMWLRRMEKEGRLTCPKVNGRRMFTAKQIEEIIQAFSPGGRGEWHYKQK